MPILNHNDLKKVEEYQTFVRTSPYANATQDLAWEKVKEGWVGEQVYLEENGQIIAAMSLIIRRVFAGFSLMYAPRAPICDLHDTALVQRLLAMVKAIRTAAAVTIPAGETTWGAVFIANGLQLIIAVLLIVLGATIVVNSMRSYVASKHNSEAKV